MYWSCWLQRLLWRLPHNLRLLGPHLWRLGPSLNRLNRLRPPLNWLNWLGSDGHWSAGGRLNCLGLLRLSEDVLIED